VTWLIRGRQAALRTAARALHRTYELAGRSPDTGDALFSSWDGARPLLQAKWSTVPAGVSARASTDSLVAMTDEQLRTYWSARFDEVTREWAGRGWLYELYGDVLSGKRVLDVGSGQGYDGVHFTRKGSSWTFLDIVESNIHLITRICRLFDVRPDGLVFMESLDRLDQLGEFDVIWANGSLHHAPFSLVRQECSHLLTHLPTGGRWMELAYPRHRWVREGRWPFDQWGRFTDGEGTPWAEWYDLAKLQERLLPAEFLSVLATEYHDADFAWFDLKRTK
jgi:SAM-dependent methyltransferase